MNLLSRWFSQKPQPPLPITLQDADPNQKTRRHSFPCLSTAKKVATFILMSFLLIPTGFLALQNILNLDDPVTDLSRECYVIGRRVLKSPIPSSEMPSWRYHPWQTGGITIPITAHQLEELETLTQVQGQFIEAPPCAYALNMAYLHDAYLRCDQEEGFSEKNGSLKFAATVSFLKQSQEAYSLNQRSFAEKGLEFLENMKKNTEKQKHPECVMLYEKI